MLVIVVSKWKDYNYSMNNPAEIGYLMENKTKLK
jgi:hypothetical protein